jgi:two-component system nitrate/nitrite response regulator NarL
VQAIENGASGYLLKNLDARNFISSLRGVERGEAAMTGELTFRLMRHIAQKAKEPQRVNNFPSASLSEREVELLRSLAQGMSNKEIAQMLSISENTVKYHCKNILQKLNLKNRTEAAAYAVQHGLTIIPETG